MRREVMGGDAESQCPVCDRADYSEPNLSQHLTTHPPVEVVAVPSDVDQWTYKTADGRRAGPFSSVEMEDLRFEGRVAQLLRVRPSDVLSARPKTLQVSKLKLRDIEASKISWVNEYIVEGQIVGESDKKAVPKTGLVYCPTCRAQEVVSLGPELQAALLFEGPAGFQKHIRNYLQDPKGSKDGEPCLHARAVILEERDYADYRLINLRTPPGSDDELDPTDFRSVKAYSVGHLIPSSKMVRTRARVLVESKTKDLVLLVTDTQPVDDEISSFHITQQDQKDFAEHYSGPNVLDRIDSYFIPRLVDQTLRKQAMYLVLHSPPWIRLPDGTRFRGLLRLLVVGDTKTFKSKSLKWVPENLRLGEMCYAETSSRTGLLYNIDSENRILVWGILPRNDLGLCLIAGFHHIAPDEMVQFREVLEFLRIKVARLVEAEAHCRTRIIADSNPRKPMKEYVFPCEAIGDLPFFKGTPDITRWDYFFTVKHGDVDQERIDRAHESPLTIPWNIQRRHILWTMSRRPENIRFTEGSLDKANEANGKIVDEYGSETLPIVHPGFKEVLIRTAVSLAATRHSVDETHENIVVTPEHVTLADSYLRALFNQNLELDRYVADEKGKSGLTDEELRNIIGKLDHTDLAILRELRHGSLQSGVMAEKLTLDDSTIRRHATSLKALELVRASRGRAGGYELGPKGIRVIRWLMLPKPGREEEPPEKGGVPSANVNPRSNVTISGENSAKSSQFTDYKGTPPQTGSSAPDIPQRGQFLLDSSTPGNDLGDVPSRNGETGERVDVSLLRDFVLRTVLPSEEDRIGYATTETIVYRCIERFGAVVENLVPKVLVALKHDGLVVEAPRKDCWRLVRP